jgi:outer membrane autotransporter protein
MHRISSVTVMEAAPNVATLQRLTERATSTWTCVVQGKAKTDMTIFSHTSVICKNVRVHSRQALLVSTVLTSCLLWQSESAYAVCTVTSSSGTTLVRCTGTDAGLSFNTSSLIGTDTDLFINLGFGGTNSEVTTTGVTAANNLGSLNIFLSNNGTGPASVTGGLVGMTQSGELFLTNESFISGPVALTSTTGNVIVTGTGDFDGDDDTAISVGTMGGQVTVDISGDVRGTEGIVVDGASRAGIFSSGDILTSGFGVFARVGNTGSAVINNSGSIEVMFGVTALGGVNTQIVNSGSIKGDGVAIQGTPNSGQFIITNTGEITGLISVGGSAVGSGLLNGGTWNATAGTSEFSGALVNLSTINLENNAVLDFVYGIGNGGVINVLGTSATLKSSFGLSSLGVSNGGLIDLSNGVAGDSVLTIDGDYDGQGGQLEVDAFLGASGSVADTIKVTGDTLGTTSIFINDVNIGLGAFNPDGIAIVDVDGTTSATHFALAGGPITKGLFRYDLVLDAATNTHELVSTQTASTSAPVAVVSGMENVWMAGVDAWSARQGTLRGNVVSAVADPPSQEDPPSAVWGSVIGNWGERDGNATRLGYDQDTYGFATGVDFGTALSDDVKAFYGLQVGYVNSKMNLNDGAGSNARLEGFDVGASASLMFGNSFVSVLAKASMLDVDLQVAGSSASVDANVYGVRGDMGHRFFVGDGLSIAPILSAQAANSDLDQFAVAGVTFQNSKNDMLWLGAGAELAYKSQDATLSFTGRVWNDLSGDRSTTLTPVGPALTVNDTGHFDNLFGEVSTKVSYSLSNSVSLYGQGQIRFDNYASTTSASAGVNVHF